MIPADQGARDAVSTRLARTLFVEAGAGTGKTTALVGRIVELVRSGAEVHRIAAITFTEAAAAELRDRVRRELERAVRDGSVSPQVTTELDNAAITTLHGFAQRLISEHPIEAGLPPAIEVLDEIQSSIEFETRWAAFTDELFERPDLSQVVLRSFATGLNLDGLRTVAYSFQDQRDRLAPHEASPPRPPLTPVDAGPVIDAIATAVAWAERCTDDSDKLLLHLYEIEEVQHSLETASSEFELLHLLVGAATVFRGGLGRVGNWSDGCKAQVVDSLESAKQTTEDLLGAVRAEILVRLIDEVRRFTLASADLRMRAGRLVFHDLLIAARDLLRSSPDVRAALHERYRYLLIDEFQDTDPLQIELAVLLASPGPVPAATSTTGWDQVELDPGRLFFVGDAKQSIYRFRRADVGLFLRIRDALADEVLRLNTNFRSVPGITSWVNEVFTDLIGAGIPGAQTAYDPLAAARPASDGPGPVVVLGTEHDLPIASIREIEATEIASVIHSAVSDSWTVQAADHTRPASGSLDDGMRPARFSDIAVLLPTRTSLPQLEAALEKALIPYRVISSSLVWGTQEVRDLLNVLQAVDDPTDQVALVAALRSPALACSDEDLVQFRNAGGRWNLRTEPPSGLGDDHPVVAGLRTLRTFHDQRWWMSVSAMIDRVIRDLRLFELAFAHDRPRDRWRRLRFVADQARSFEQSPGSTLRHFLAWAQRQATDDARVREPSLPESDDDAVQILTVHGAKGLEFPITIVSGLNRPLDKRAATVLWNDEGRPEVRVGPFRTDGYSSVKEMEQHLDHQERVRLLYVATTRAQDHLVVSLHRPSKRTNTHAHELARICDGCPDLWRSFEAASSTAVDAPGELPTHEDAEQFLAEREAAWAERNRLLTAARRRDSSTATAMAAWSAHDAEDSRPDAEPGAHTAVWRRGRAGTAIGRAVHAVLQTIDLASGDGLEDAARAQASAERVDDAWREVARAVRAAIDSDVVRDAVRRRHWRELYVAAPIGSALVEGFVDLLVETPDGLVVIDYKTDQVRTAGDVAAAAARYRLQLATYAVVLEQALGKPVVGAALLFISGRRAQTHWVADVAAATSEVRARFATGLITALIDETGVPQA